MVGQIISHYRVVEKLGAGGMGVVWKARDTLLDRDVAIKVLPSGAMGDPAGSARLLREARLASKLNHPHICTIYEVGEADGQVFIAMELVEGQSLSSRLAAGALPAGQVLRLGLQLADALDHAHCRCIVHRDFKSANIVITPEGRAKVLDFGLAKRFNRAVGEDAVTQTQESLTGPGAVIGTVAYMAPEQLRGDPADARSDIWALGVVLYEMSSGKRPFLGKSAFELSSAILNAAPAPLPETPGERAPAVLRTVIERCLEKEPARRYQQSAEVWAVLESVEGSPAPRAWVAWERLLARRRWTAAAAVVVFLLAVAGALEVSGVRSRIAGGTAAPEYRALAVLPVVNLSGDAGQEYFTDGMTDALITSLSKVGALRVISRTSVMRYKGTKKRLPEIARDLNVDTVLEASVLREADRVRITAQLVEAATDRHLWAESYEREMSSILAVQSEVARAVAQTVQVKLQPQDEARLKARQVNPVTYEAYLRGMFHLNKSSMEDTLKGLEYLHKAVEIDPADPLAHAGLALGYVEVAHGAEAREDSMRRAKAAAMTALKLDPSLAEATAAMGFVKGYMEWNWDEAFRDIETALDANPSLAIAYYHRSWFHALFGRMNEAIVDHKRAQAVDPFNPLHTAWLGELYRWERRYDEAAREARKSIEIAPRFPPGHYVLGLVYQDQGRHEEAIEAIRKAAEASPNWRWSLGPVYAAAGRTQEARQLLAELNRQESNPSLESWRAFWRVMICASLGENDEALRWMNYEPHHIWLAWVRVLPWGGLAELRKDPRFPAQLRRMNLPPLAR